MNISLTEIIGYIISFLAGATISFYVTKINLSKKYNVSQSHNNVKGDLIGRDKVVR